MRSSKIINVKSVQQVADEIEMYREKLKNETDHGERITIIIRIMALEVLSELIRVAERREVISIPPMLDKAMSAMANSLVNIAAIAPPDRQATVVQWFFDALREVSESHPNFGGVITVDAEEHPERKLDS